MTEMLRRGRGVGEGQSALLGSQGKVVHLSFSHKERICLQKTHFTPQFAVHACWFGRRKKAVCSQVTQKRLTLGNETSSKGEIFSVR